MVSDYSEDGCGACFGGGYVECGKKISGEYTDDGGDVLLSDDFRGVLRGSWDGDGECAGVLDASVVGYEGPVGSDAGEIVGGTHITGVASDMSTGLPEASLVCEQGGRGVI